MHVIVATAYVAVVLIAMSLFLLLFRGHNDE